MSLLKTKTEISSLLGKGKMFIYDAVKKATALEKNKEFIEDCANRGKTVIEELNELFQVIGQPWAHLEAAIIAFPKKSDWKTGNLVQMINEGIDDTRLKIAKPNKPRKTRDAVSRADLVRVERKSKEQIKLVKNDLKNKDEIIAELKAEITRLQRENTRLTNLVDKLTNGNRKTG